MGSSSRDRLGLTLMLLAVTLAVLGWASLIGTALHTDGSDLHAHRRSVHVQP